MKVFCSGLFVSLVLISFSALGNVVGTHQQNFNPTTNGLDFVTVQSTKTLAPGQFNLGFFGNYATNSLPYFKAPFIPNTQKFSEPNDKLLSADVNIGFGIMDNWDVGLSIPSVLDQDIKRSVQLGAFDDTGVTEIRLNTKYRVFEQEMWAIAFMGGVNFDRIKNNPFTGNDAGPTWNLESVFDYKISPIMLWAFNLGYRVRDQGEIIADSGVTPLSDQLIYSSAFSYLYESWKTTFIFELFGSALVKNIDIPTDRHLSNLEALAGAKVMVDPKIALHGGIGTGLYNGLASPDLRLYLGVNWSVGPIWGDTPAPVVAAPTPAVESQPILEEEPSETIVLSSSAINFDVASTEMTPASRKGMKTTAAQIRNNPGTVRKIVVEGHTDSTGTDEYNQKLSEKRAQAVRKALLEELSLQPDQIAAVGYGEKRPIDRNDTNKGKSRNRRVELKIYRNK